METMESAFEERVYCVHGFKEQVGHHQKRREVEQGNGGEYIWGKGVHAFKEQAGSHHERREVEHEDDAEHLRWKNVYVL